MRWRQYLKRRLRSGKIAVLMYHRIANPKRDPWQLSVSPENFEAHLKLLKKKYIIITPQQLLKERQRKWRRRNCVCITFDDGYLDNYTAAKPLLEKYRCPATYFITTQSLQTGAPFWWDELEEIILASPKLPSPFSFNIKGEAIRVELESEGRLTAEQKALHKNWVWSDKPPTQRCQLYYRLWEKMRAMPQEEIDALLQKLKTTIGIAEVNLNGAVPMTLSDLKETSRSPLLHIGLHTHTHPLLPAHDRSFQKKEWEENKKMLEQTCGYRMKFMSYPHGRYNEDTLALAREMGIAAAFTTTTGIITPQLPLYELGRYQVLNWNGHEFETALGKIFNR